MVDPASQAWNAWAREKGTGEFVLVAVHRRFLSAGRLPSVFALPRVAGWTCLLQAEGAAILGRVDLRTHPLMADDYAAVLERDSSKRHPLCP